MYFGGISAGSIQPGRKIKKDFSNIDQQRTHGLKKLFILQCPHVFVVAIVVPL